MTSKRNLGPVLALAGAGIAAAAMIAGLIIIGGPGDTRDKRIDHQRLAHVAQAIGVLDCAYAITPEAPNSLAAALEAFARHPELAMRTDCAYPPEGAARSLAEVEYRKLSSSTVELCRTFQRPEPSPPRINDPDYADVIYADGPFGYPVLDVPRPSAGRFCYTINLAEQAAIVATRWDEPLDIDALEPGLAGRARADKRAIGDVVNLLRLLRCARDVGAGIPDTFEAAVAAVDAAGTRAHEFNCDWPGTFYGFPENLPVATYARLENSVATVCVMFAANWPAPLQLNYYGEALDHWPTSLPALQVPVTAGAHCYEVDISIAPPDGSRTPRPEPH